MPCEVRIYAFTRMRAGGSLAHPLAECYFVDVLLLVAVTAFENAMNFIHYIENSLHGFVVGNAFGIVAFNNAAQFVRSFHRLLLHYLKITYHTQYDFWGHHRQTVDFFVSEQLVRDFDDTLAPAFPKAIYCFRRLMQSPLYLYSS